MFKKADERPMRRMGPRYRGHGRCEFRIWAPLLERLSLRLVSGTERSVPLAKEADGSFAALIEGVRPGDRYLYRPGEGPERPDPLSHGQPDGVFGASSVVDHDAFHWHDRDWRGIPREEMIIYELHVGAFTPEGTFEGVIAKLPYLQDLGVNAVELMPVAQFPGTRNWGYDGVYPFAVQNSYGGPEGLKSLVDGCHARSLAVILDVVYNHLGPEGCFLGEFMPCFAARCRTPWGPAMNLDEAYSHGLRELLIQNALHWLGTYHIDALRLDAIHGLYDVSAKHFLRELAERVEEFSRADGRRRYLIAESDLNDARVVRPARAGGFGLDAQWNDDFHHSLHALLTGERQGYYADFGRVGQMAKAVREGFVYSWDYSRFRKRFYGSSTRGFPGSRFVVFSQNHDQVGNRMGGERLASLVSFEGLKVAAGLVLLAANVPLLFMGEESGEDAPFPYFADFGDGGLVRAVREGRARMFAAAGWPGRPVDPFDEAVFERAKLAWPAEKNESSRVLLDLYRTLIRLRREIAAVSRPDPDGSRTRFDERAEVLAVSRSGEGGGIRLLANFNDRETAYRLAGRAGRWRKVLDTSEARWLGPGSRLPDEIGGEARLRLPPLGLSLYRRLS
jgi:maltooligosyltrehalose trehalohydrolase